MVFAIKQGVVVSVDFQEFSTEELDIPSLSVKRNKLSDGTLRCIVNVTKTKWDPEKKRPYSAESKTVGVIANNQEYGPIVFKDAFLKQYPQLRNVTVLRKEGRKYVYIKTPMKVDAETVGYHKQGRKRYAPPPQIGGKTKIYGITMLCSQVAERYGIVQSLIATFGKRMGLLILVIAIGLIIQRRSSLSGIKHVAESHFLSTAKLPLSSSSLTALCKKITSGQANHYYAHLTQFLLKLSPSDELSLFAIDSTAIPCYSKNNSRAAWGHPKKDHPELPQMNLSCVTHMETGIACFMRPISGQVPDKISYKHDLEYIVSALHKLSKLEPGTVSNLRFTQVFDRGYVSLKNLAIAVEHAGDFVCCLPDNLCYATEAKTHATAENDHICSRKHLLSSISESTHHVAMPASKCPTITTENHQKKLYLHAYYDPLKGQDRYDELNAIASAIIAARNKGTYDELSKRVKDLDRRIALVTKDEQGYWGPDHVAMQAEAEKSCDWVLATTRADLDGAQVLNVYRKRNEVEESFRTSKGMGFDRLGTGNFAVTDGRLLLFAVSLQLEQGLQDTVSRAKKGEYGLLPSSREKQIFNSIPNLLSVMQSITCYVDEDDVKADEIVGITRNLLEEMGFKLALGRDDAESTDLLEQAISVAEAWEEGLRVKS